MAELGLVEVACSGSVTVERATVERARSSVPSDAGVRDQDVRVKGRVLGPGGVVAKGGGDKKPEK